MKASLFVCVAACLLVASAQAQAPIAESIASRVQQRRNATWGTVQNVAPTLASLFSQAVANTNTAGTATGGSAAGDNTFITGVANNFQKLLTDQAAFYNNLLSTFSSSQPNVAARTICDLGALYQALPSLLTSSSNPYAALLSGSAGSAMTNTLSTLLSDSAYARVFNQECSRIEPASGNLASVAARLLSNSTIAEQVQAAIARGNSQITGRPSSSGGRPTAAGTVPAYLQGTQLGTFLQAISTPGSGSGSGNGGSNGANGSLLGNTLLAAYLESLSGSARVTGSSSPGTGAGLGLLSGVLNRSPASGAVGEALVNALGAATQGGQFDALNRIRAQAQSNSQGRRLAA